MRGKKSGSGTGIYMRASLSTCILLICLLCGLLSVPATAAEPLELVITGIEGDALKNARLALELPYGLVRDGRVVDRLWLERFARQAEQEVRTALEPFGYYHPLVRIHIEARDKDTYRLLVQIEPGMQTVVNEVKVILEGPGAHEKQLRRLAAAFPLKQGGALLHLDYEQAKSTLQALAIDLGYLDATFLRNEIRVSDDASRADVYLTLATGKKYRFDGVTIRGAPDYPEEFLRRYLTFASGDIFSYAKLGETQQNFSGSERFKQVLITPEVEKAVDLKVPVQIQLIPAPRRTLRPGIGYGTDTGARLTLRFRDLNAFQLGHEYNAQLFLAERLQGFATAYTIPSPRDIRSNYLLQFNVQREDISSYVSRLIALEAAANRSFGTKELGTAYLKLQQEEFTIAGHESNSRLVLPGLRFSSNHYNNLLRPNRGFRYALELRGSHQVMGSDTALLQALAEGGYLLPLPGRLSLNLRGKTATTMLSDPLSEIPPSLRFFAGGDQSIRGYSYKSLGPKDASGKVVGGKNLLVGSVELERALFEKWGVSVFYDAGNAFNTFDKVKIYQGAGVGLHYYSQVGALNLSLARQIGHGRSNYHLHFTVGFEF